MTNVKIFSFLVEVWKFLYFFEPFTYVLYGFLKLFFNVYIVTKTMNFYSNKYSLLVHF